jgi:DNA ligase (NAD+)
MRVLKKKTKVQKVDDLTGLVFAISGTLSRPRAEIIQAIEAGGGKFVSSVTKAVTHLLVADPGDTSEKIKKARQDGKKIVTEDFLEDYL